MKITVLVGGLSPERDVSLSSGSLIANALIKRKHSVALVDVLFGTEEEYPFDSLFKREGNYSYDIPNTEPDLEALKASVPNNSLIGKNVLELCRASDAVFIATHGGMGENGQLQATLDCHGITKYTGSSYIGCMLAMDKNISKHLISGKGVPTAPWIMFDTENDCICRIKNEVGLPCVVKPCGCGSSVGVSIVDGEDSLDKALKYASKYEKTVLVEKKIVGREFSVGVLLGRALPPIEIIPLNGWYDYSNKYQGGCTKEITPAELTREETERIQSLAIKAHDALHLGIYSRVDFLLDESTGDFVCLEANALPGMTPNSLLPQEAQAAGISYEELCDILVKAAFEN